MKKAIFLFSLLAIFLSCRTTQIPPSRSYIMLYHLPCGATYDSWVNAEYIKRNTITKPILDKDSSAYDRLWKLTHNNLIHDSTTKKIDGRVLIEFYKNEVLLEKILLSGKGQLEVNQKIYLEIPQLSNVLCNVYSVKCLYCNKTK